MCQIEYILSYVITLIGGGLPVRHRHLVPIFVATAALVAAAASPAVAAPDGTASAAPRTLSQLLQLRDALPQREPFASAAGSSLSMWYPDPSTGKVVAGVTTVTPTIVAAARITWGDAVTVVQRDRFSVASKVARMTSAVKVAITSTKPPRAPR
jgi:hypothetical protein